MALSNKLVSKFVKATKNDTKNKNEKIVYGKIVKIDHMGTPDAIYYAQIDGAEHKFNPNDPDDYTGLIPISHFNENVDVDNRLIITIKDHNAIVTGSITADKNPVSVAKKIDDALASINIGTVDLSDIKALWPSNE